MYLVLTLALLVGLLIVVLLGTWLYVRCQEQRRRDNLKKIGIALNDFHERHGRYPGYALASPDGKPLLSWRVAILPDLGEARLYQQFKVDEPWDSPANQKLLLEMPAVYGKARQSRTCYRVFTGPGTIFEHVQGIPLSDVTDGLTNTAFVVEAAEEVPWTKPEELPYMAGKPLPKFGAGYEDGFFILYADGQTRLIRKNFKEQRMRLAIVRNDGWGFPDEPGQP
jgi:hypothetical protein